MSTERSKYREYCRCKSPKGTLPFEPFTSPLNLSAPPSIKTVSKLSLQATLYKQFRPENFKQQLSPVTNAMYLITVKNCRFHNFPRDFVTRFSHSLASKLKTLREEIIFAYKKPTRIRKEKIEKYLQLTLTFNWNISHKQNKTTLCSLVKVPWGKNFITLIFIGCF